MPIDRMFNVKTVERFYCQDCPFFRYLYLYHNLECFHNSSGNLPHLFNLKGFYNKYQMSKNWKPDESYIHGE